MPAVFSDRTGQVSVVTGNGIAPAALTISTGTLQLSSNPVIVNNTIVTSISVNENVNAQFALSLNKSVHAYIFGDQVGQMEIGGMAFGSMCFKGTVPQPKSGLLRIQEIYHANKMSSRAQPLLIDISGISYSCFLTGGRFGFVDPQNNVAQWSFSLASVKTQS